MEEAATAGKQNTEIQGQEPRGGKCSLGEF